MSQFSQKYYKHYIVKGSDEIVEVSFWHRIGVLQAIILLLLFLLLILLLFVCSKCNCFIQNRTDVMTQKRFNTEILSTSQEEKEQIPRKKEQSQQTKTLTLQEKIPKQVLPDISQLVPKSEVTLEEYMYYVNDTSNGYPKYVDKSSNRIIKEYKPPCARPDCPVSGISQEEKMNYVNWLNEMGETKYKIKETGKGFRVEAK